VALVADGPRLSGAERGRSRAAITIVSALDPTTRVCPRCGRPAEAGAFCAGCGLNLGRERELPTRAEFEARHVRHDRRGRRRRRALVAVAGVAALAAVVVAGALVLSSGHRTRRYRVPSASMLPTIKVGERVTVDLDAYEDAAPRRGDIVIFHPPQGADTDSCGRPDRSERAACDIPKGGPSPLQFIKRIVAVGGDRLSLRHGVVYLGGVRVAEPYISGPCTGEVARGCELPDEIVVPPGHYFMLGDTRAESDDSRFWGPVPGAAIVGKVRR
jgi:signal peptidase I